MAPELISGKGYTIAVDLWSLGVVLHWLISGKLPFAHGAASEMEIFRAVLDGRLQPDSLNRVAGTQLTKGLLQPSTELRLGWRVGDLERIRDDALFLNIHTGPNFFGSLVSRLLTPPCVPEASLGEVLKNTVNEDDDTNADEDGDEDQESDDESTRAPPTEASRNSTPEELPELKPL